MATGRTKRGPYKLVKVTAEYTASAESMKTVSFPSGNNPFTDQTSYVWTVVGFNTGNTYIVMNNIHADISEMMVVYNPTTSNRSGTARLDLLGIPKKMLGIN